MSISVIIPTYNRCEFVLKALASVTKQSLAPHEIIVVDDGSIDDTGAAIRARFPQVIILSQANCGVSAARNLGIKRASGQWIALLDSDDQWHPQKLELQFKRASECPETSLIHCDERWIRNGKPLNQKAYHQKSGGDLFAESLHRCMISPSAAMVRKSLLSAVGLFDEQLPACEDYDLWLRICAHHEVAYVNEKLVTKFGGHKDQLSQSIWGLDRFRIRALSKLLLGGSLNPQQAKLANQVLQKKTQIFTQGALKRGRSSEAQQLVQLAEQMQQLCA